MEKRKLGHTGIESTILGFGSMRMPTVGEGDNKVLDEEKAIELIRGAIDRGISYVDTAWGYHNEKSEVAVGKALLDGYRNKVTLVTKSPVWKIEKREDFRTLLHEQLRRLQTDHLDIYLLHALSKERWELVKEHGILEELQKVKDEGIVKAVGFSFHDDEDVFYEILNGFDGWDVVQLQMNYVDTDYQSTWQGLVDAYEKGLGVIIMEPLRGGKLVNLPEWVSKELPGDQLSSAFNWLYDKKEVSVVLSGMNNLEQVEENIEVAKKAQEGMLTEEDNEKYKKAKEVFDTMSKIPCTQCEYCLPCAVGIDIPRVLESYNKIHSRSESAGREQYEKCDVKALDCISCRLCEDRCPQFIRISEWMKEISATFDK